MPARVFADARHAYVLSFGAMATAEYPKNLIYPPPFSEVVPLFCRVQPIKHLFVAGRMVRKKGFEDLLNAMHQVRRTWPQIHLQIAGDGPEPHRLTESAPRIGH